MSSQVKSSQVKSSQVKSSVISIFLASLLILFSSCNDILRLDENSILFSVQTVRAQTFTSNASLHDFNYYFLLIDKSFSIEPLLEPYNSDLTVTSEALSNIKSNQGVLDFIMVKNPKDHNFMVAFPCDIEGKEFSIISFVLNDDKLIFGSGLNHYGSNPNVEKWYIAKKGITNITLEYSAAQEKVIFLSSSGKEIDISSNTLTPSSPANGASLFIPSYFQHGKYFLLDDISLTQNIALNGVAAEFDSYGNKINKITLPNITIGSGASLYIYNVIFDCQNEINLTQGSIILGGKCQVPKGIKLSSGRCINLASTLTGSEEIKLDITDVKQGELVVSSWEYYGFSGKIEDVRNNFTFVGGDVEIKDNNIVKK